MTLADIGIRLFVATVIGCLICLNRFAHHRFIGVRTLGLVSLGAAALIVAALETGSGSDQLAAASRIIQGIVTGIGFIGAGVIVQRERGHKVHGLNCRHGVGLGCRGHTSRARSMACRSHCRRAGRHGAHDDVADLNAGEQT
jgi:uncharacterized membrane protein YhiD involved in acid resistance